MLQCKSTKDNPTLVAIIDTDEILYDISPFDFYIEKFYEIFPEVFKCTIYRLELKIKNSRYNI